MKASHGSARPSERHFGEAQLLNRHLAMANLQLCGGQQPFFCSGDQKGEEAASPGNQSRKRVSGSFPPALLSRESPVPLALPQSTGPAKNSHVSLDSLSFTSRRSATQKRHATVKKLWTF